MQYREFLSLTDEEIKFILNDIFSPIDIGEIERVDNDLIRADIFIMPEYPGIADTIDLTPVDMDTHDFDLSGEETWKWTQFLLAKGIDERLKDNPYLEQETPEIGTDIEID